MNQMSQAEMTERILRLKKEKNVLILAHYYQELCIQHIADFCGDSFELAKKARGSSMENIVFCGVSFMAESAKIMNPEKHVYLPRADAGCQMADMITPEVVLKMRAEHPDACVVCYINSSAATKAVSDICVTSSNAVKIVGTLKEKEIIFVPDQNLGSFVADAFPDKRFYFMNGFCPIHHHVTSKALDEARAAHPNAKIAMHPECQKEMLSYADYVGSTSGILDYCRESKENEYIIVTERAILDRLREECPDKSFYLASDCLVCPNMKKTRLCDVLSTLESLDDEVYMTEEQMQSARLPLERMLSATKN